MKMVNQKTWLFDTIKNIACVSNIPYKPILKGGDSVKGGGEMISSPPETIAGRL